MALLELRAILHTIEWSLAWHFAPPSPPPHSPLVFFPNRIWRQRSPASFKSLQALLKHFSPKAGTNLMASFGPAYIERIDPFFFCCKSFVNRGNKGLAQWSASRLAGWIEGPLSWLFMSTPLQKHTYKSHPVLPLAPLIPGWFGEGKGGCSCGASLSFHSFHLMDFHPVSPRLYYLIHQFVVMGSITCYMLHKNNMGIKAENIIKMFYITETGQKIEFDWIWSSLFKLHDDSLCF